MINEIEFSQCSQVKAQELENKRVHEITLALIEDIKAGRLVSIVACNELHTS